MPRHKVPHAATLHATKPKIQIKVKQRNNNNSNTFPHSCLRLMLIVLLLLLSYFFFSSSFFCVYFFIVPYKSVDVANWKTRWGFLTPSVSLSVCECESVCIGVLLCLCLPGRTRISCLPLSLSPSLSHFGGELGNIAGISLTFALIIVGFSNRFRTRVCVT